MKNLINWFNNSFWWIQETTGITLQIQSKMIITILWIIVLILIRKILLRLVFKKIEDYKSRYTWRKYTTYVLYFIIIFLIGKIWLNSFNSLTTFLGLLSAGIAIALKDPLVNFVGWAFILIRKPFEPGDRVQVGEHAGDVIDVGFFQFTLIEIGNWVDADQSTGRILHVPNGKVFSEVQANYHKGFDHIWHEIPVVLTFESNWGKAKDILSNLINKHAKSFNKDAEVKLKNASSKYLIFYTKLTPIVYTSVKDHGVCLTIRYLCEPRKRRGSSQKIWEDMLNEFSGHKDIDFAYPTQRFYNNISEGKNYSEDSKNNDPV